MTEKNNIKSRLAPKEPCTERPDKKICGDSSKQSHLYKKPVVSLLAIPIYINSLSLSPLFEWGFIK